MIHRFHKICQDSFSLYRIRATFDRPENTVKRGPCLCQAPPLSSGPCATARDTFRAHLLADTRPFALQQFPVAMRGWHQGGAHVLVFGFSLSPYGCHSSIRLHPWGLPSYSSVPAMGPRARAHATCVFVPTCLLHCACGGAATRQLLPCQVP